MEVRIGFNKFFGANTLYFWEYIHSELYKTLYFVDIECTPKFYHLAPTKGFVSVI